MSEPLPDHVEQSLQIAWDFLERTGQIADPYQTAEFLLYSIRARALTGECRPLMLSNRAIDAYRHQKLAA